MARVLKHIKALQILFLVLGLILFYYVVSKVGFGEIAASVRLMGFGFVVVMAISAVRHWLRSVAWLHCIEEDHRNIRIHDLFNVRLAGDAVRLLSFTGPFLGETSKAVLIPNGAFFNDTGGNWVFVVNESGTSAERRAVQLGRKNNDFIEVLDGLKPDEKVITSSYSGLVDKDHLSFDTGK